MSQAADEFDAFVQKHNLSDLLSAKMSAEEQLSQAVAEIERLRARRQEERNMYEQELEEMKRVTAEIQRNSQSVMSSQKMNSETSEPLSTALLSIGDVIRQQSETFENLQEVLRNLGQSDQGQIISATNAQQFIREFYGNEGPEKAQAWINELMNTKTLYNWTDAVVLSVAKARLKGGAWKWLMTKSTTLTTFAAFKDAFTTAFTYKRSRCEKLKAMISRVQARDELIQDYFLDKVWLCEGLNFEIDDVRDEVAAGLWSRELAQHMLGQKYESTDSMLQDLVRIEKVHSSRTQRITEQRDRRNLQRDSNRNRILKAESAGSAPTTRTATATTSAFSLEGREKSAKCYNCGDIGHISRACNKPKREITCFLCKRPGHIATRCSLNKSNVVNVLSEVNNSDVGSKFIREIKVDSKSFTALIDMGATVCTIRAIAVLCAGFKVNNVRSSLEGFGGQRVESPGVVILPIQLDNLKPRNTTLRIVPDTAQKEDIIIGQPFTEASDITYTRYGNELKFSDVNVNEIQESATFKMRSLDNVNVDPGTIRFVRVQADTHELEVPIVNDSSKMKNIEINEKIGESVLSITSAPELKPRYEPIKSEEIITDPSVTTEQKQKLLDLLNTYRICIAKGLDEIGKTDLVTMDIEVVDDKPICSRPYRLNAKDRHDLENLIDEYKRVGIVTETNSKHASPAFVVRKKDGSARMVIDYRKVNQITKRVHFPIPNLDELLQEISEARYFIALDLYLGYLQMPLTEKAKELTAFITETTTGQFERAMLGLTCAPMYYSKLMEIALRPAKRKRIAFNFFDDAFIHATTWDQLMQNLEFVLECLKRAGLTLNLKKCKFGLLCMEYLGYIFGRGELKPGDRKIVAIEQFPTPRDKHEIRRFVGLASFFRRFIPKFAEVAKPLTALLKNDVEFEWTADHETAFLKIKSLLVSRPVLKLYNANACKTELHTDASSIGIAGMLLQADFDGEPLKLVYAVSRCTTEVESKYHSSRLELMAIAWSLSRLRTFLIGLKFTVVTDCQSLVYLNAWKTKNAQISRWMGEISEFDLEIKHKRGELMQHVDALSRAPVVDVESEHRINIIKEIKTKEDEILVFQRSDPAILAQINILRKPDKERTRLENSVVKDLVLRDGLLFKEVVRDDKVVELFVIPKAMRKYLVIKYHDLNSHFGVTKTVKRIEQYYYFPRLRRYVRMHIKNCLECILAKRKVGPGEGELHPIPPGKRPFEIIHVDHVGPFPTTPRGNKFILGIIDNLTKFVVFEPVKNVTGLVTVRKMEEFVDRFGAPVRIVSDRGTSFTSHLFQEFCLTHGIKHTLNSSRHPQANGLIERMNQTLVPSLRIGEHPDWDKNVKRVERDINGTVSAATGKEPFKALFGYLPRFKDRNLRELTANVNQLKIWRGYESDDSENFENDSDSETQSDDNLEIRNENKNITPDVDNVSMEPENPVTINEIEKNVNERPVRNRRKPEYL